jgi:predicted nucleic acid-binding protein
VAKFFFDTDILISMFDRSDPQKQGKAHALVKNCLKNGCGVISTQVLQEFAAVALSKLRHSCEVVLRELAILQSQEVVQLTPELIRSAVELFQDVQLPFWDAAIVAAAKHARCEVLYSENFPAGAVYGNVRVENPLL